MKTKRSFIYIVFVISSSCYFQPDDDPFIDIPEKKFDDLAIDLNVLNDTIFLATQQSFQFTGQATGYQLYQVTAIVDDDTIHTSNAFTGSFNLSPVHYSDGFHKLSISMAVFSGTGSLADKLGAELAGVTRAYTLVVDKTPPLPITPTFDDKTGALVLNWPAHTGWNFVKYIIVKYCEPGISASQCKRVEITDAHTTTWTDTDFVGGYARYRIALQASINTVHGPEVTYQWYPKTSQDLNGRIGTAKWSRPKFFMSTKSVTLSTVETGLKTINATDTTFQFAAIMKLGQSSIATVTFVPASPSAAFSFQARASLGDGYAAPSIFPSSYNQHENLYYGTMDQNSSLVVMDQEFKPLATKYIGPNSIRLTTSRDGKNIILYAYNGGTPALYFVEPRTLELSGMSRPRYLTTSNLAVANNGFLTYSSSLGYMILKLPSFAEFYFNHNGVVFGAPFAISPSGNYLIEKANIMALNGTAFVQSGTFTTVNSPPFVFLNSEDVVTLSLNGLLTLIDIPSGTVVKTLQLPLNPATLISYDPVADRLHVGYETNAYLVSSDLTKFVKVETSTFTQLINAKLFAVAPSGSGFAFVVVDHTIFDNP